MYILYQTLFIIFPRQKLENKNYNDTNTNVHVLESVTHDLQWRVHVHVLERDTHDLQWHVYMYMY
jgi:hypothetical protein